MQANTTSTTYIKGLGHYLPTKTISNADLEKLVDTSNEWIMERTGIQSRHVAAPDQFTTDLAYEASSRALTMAGVDAKDIQAIVFATATQEAVLPQAACILQKKLGAVNAFAFDLSAACTGFIYALSVADALVKAQGLQNVLVVGAETLTRVTDYTDRETCILFGDGAGAVLLGSKPHDGLQLHTHLASIGTLCDLLTLKKNLPNDPPFLQMRGREVFKHAVKGLVESSQIVMEKAGLKPADIDWFVPHQANQRIMSAVADNLGFRDHQIATSIESTGNTSSASIPIVLSQYFAAGKIRRGNKVLMAAFGAGITHGAALIEF